VAATTRGDAQPGSPARATEPRRRFHVLVADDYLLNLRLITRLLQMNDFVVTAVADGGAALAALQASFAPPPPDADAAHPPPHPPFDLAVLDMDMPVLRGPQVAAAFRAFESVARPHAMRLPIFALTANVLEEHARECMDAG
jgi:CheY-like chemotaxis protein